MYEGISDLNRSWPAECPEDQNLTSIPQLQSHSAIVQINRLGEKVDANRGLVVQVEGVVHEAGNDRGFPNSLLPQEHKLVLVEGLTPGRHECVIYIRDIR